MLRAGLGLLTTLALVPTATTQATWTDSSVMVAPVQARTLVTADLACHEEGSSAVISWTPVKNPTDLVYSAIVDGRTRPVATNSRVTVSPALLGSVLGRDYIVEITGTLPATNWTTKSERKVRLGLLGLYVVCA